MSRLPERLFLAGALAVTKGLHGAQDLRVFRLATASKFDPLIEQRQQGVAGRTWWQSRPPARQSRNAPRLGLPVR